MPISWSSLGEMEVTDVWQIFPVEVTSDTFRVTTTVTDVAGWESLRIRSGAYLQFIYPDSTKSQKIYIPVLEDATVYELPVPQGFREEGYLLRSISCRLASRWVGKIDFISGFAKWNLKIEELI
ncbi:MAG: hypothetical protein V7K40_31005 [Nostoc sp.]|uniref:hypothetical protein n=1 Tax=Nostoc sp. TaxID=1180 RepID=UPI002FFBEF22